MDLGIKNKVAIVAASTKGLGLAVALNLASEGALVTICSRDRDNLKSAKHKVENETGTQVLAIQADVSKDKDIEQVISKTLEIHPGGIDILVNNAGGPPYGMFEDFDIDTWQSAIELNLFSTIRFSKKVIPFMKRNNWGRIVNITSFAVKQPQDGLILSNTVRAGIIGLAKTLSNEMAKHNILINNVCPGIILTDRIIYLAEERAKKQNKTYDQVIDDMNKKIPIGRIGNPEEFSNLLVFLCSEKNSYITGTTIQIDGGLVQSIF